jgi:predicted ArsR family transcriptional regulator
MDTGAKLRDALSKLLSAFGYEPKTGAEGELRLHNCPFDSLAAQYRSTVCQINLALQQGLIEGLGASGRLRAELQPAPGSCCVTLLQVRRS